MATLGTSGRTRLGVGGPGHSAVPSAQIDRYAQQDLKKGLHLYGTQGNVGLTNAWSIIQTDVRHSGCREAGRALGGWAGCREAGWALGGRGGLPTASPSTALALTPAVPLLWCLQLH